MVFFTPSVMAARAGRSDCPSGDERKGTNGVGRDKTKRQTRCRKAGDFRSGSAIIDIECRAKRSHDRLEFLKYCLSQIGHESVCLYISCRLYHFPAGFVCRPASNDRFGFINPFHNLCTVILQKGRFCGVEVPLLPGERAGIARQKGHSWKTGARHDCPNSYSISSDRNTSKHQADR